MEYYILFAQHLPNIIYLILLVVFAVIFILTAKRNKLSWSGLIMDSEGKSVSRMGLISWIIFFVMLYLWINEKQVHQSLVEVFGLCLVFLFGSKANVTYKTFLQQKKEELKSELEQDIREREE